MEKGMTPENQTCPPEYVENPYAAEAARARAACEQAQRELEEKQAAYARLLAAGGAAPQYPPSSEQTRPGRARRKAPPPPPAADESAPPRKRRGRRGRRGRRALIKAILVLAAIIAAILILGPKVQRLLGLKTAFTVETPQSVAALLPDETMGYVKLDFAGAILGETRDKKQLVVMEQDVQVDSTISQALANLAIFSKTKVVHSYGTGAYAVDLAKISEKSVAVDETRKLVTVTIPLAELYFVNLDVAKTTFEDTEKALLAFGDVKLTQEQQKILETSIDEAMRKKLGDPALLAQADTKARDKLYEIFRPLIRAVSESYSLEIALAD